MAGIMIALVTLSAVLVLTGLETGATKIVQRQHKWEILVGYEGSQDKRGSGEFIIYVIADPDKPCDPNARHFYVDAKYGVRTRQIVGEQAFYWMQDHGLAVYQNGRWRKTKALDEWGQAKSARHLYWQACGGESPSSSGRCGRKLEDAEIVPLINWINGLESGPWDRQYRYNDVRVGIAARNLRRELGAGTVRYEVNSNIWRSKVNCIDGCIRRTPKDLQRNREASAAYQQCLDGCNQSHRYEKCP